MESRGSVRHAATGTTVELRADQVCVRAKNADVRLDNPKVSAPHARIRWRKTHWELSDQRRRALGGSLPL